MATGAYDANGIWQYGEDDNIALFSDLLKLGTASTSTAFTADRARLATLEAGSLAALIPLKPTSVVVATGTAAMNTKGTVTFTGATSVSLNNVFSSTYSSYRVMVMINGTSAAGEIRLRMRRGSTDVVANYSQGGLTAPVSGGNSAFNGSGLSYISIGGNATSPTSAWNSAIVEVRNPASTDVKAWTATGTNYLPGTGNATWFDGGHCTDAGYADGITILCSAGTFTGTIIVLGYNA